MDVIFHLAGLTAAGPYDPKGDLYGNVLSTINTLIYYIIVETKMFLLVRWNIWSQHLPVDSHIL